MNKPDDGQRRTSRMARELREIVARFLLHGFRQPLKGFVTVSEVIVTRDLRSAKVYVSTLGGQDEGEENVDTLNDFAFEIQKHVASNLDTKFCPKLKFYDDENSKRVLRVQQILKGMEKPTDE